MKKNKELPKLGKKGTVAGLVMCFVVMIMLVGVFTFGQYQDNVSSEFAEAELLENSLTQDELMEQAELDIPEVEETNTTDIINEEIVEEEPVTSEEISNTNASIEAQIAYSGESKLIWPVNGGIIMQYNMEQAVYFETLDQYKKNSAMIIDGEVGTEVLAAEIGTVLTITEEVETGTTITVDMGNGYTAVYGQVTDVRVTEGSLVEQGQIIAVLAEPTKYYSIEGCNLYFQMYKDGETVDPLDYLIQ